MKLHNQAVNFLCDRENSISESEGEYQWDAINSFSFDRDGYLRWYSPASDGEKVTVDHADLLAKLQKRGFAVEDKDGFISL